jgi:hypothetical protein
MFCKSRIKSCCGRCDREFDPAGHRESQLDGVMIFGADMEPGHQSFAAIMSREMPDKTRGEPLPRCAADAADLRIAVERYTFSPIAIKLSPARTP